MSSRRSAASVNSTSRARSSDGRSRVGAAGASTSRGRSSTRSGKDKTRAPSPELIDDEDEREQSAMLVELSKIVTDLHDVDGIGLKDVGKSLNVHLEVPDAKKKVNVLVIGSGGVGMEFVEWYIGDRLANSGVAGYGEFTVVTNGLSSRTMHGHEAMLAQPSFKKMENISGVSRAFVFQELAITKRKLDAVNVVIAPVIEGVVRASTKGWQEQALAVMRDNIGRNAQNMLRMFRSFDINKDRKISLPEFRKGLENMDLGHLSEQQAAELMNMIDLDQNGYINYEDFVASFKPHPVKYDFDLEEAMMAAADASDVILTLLDPATMRFNIRELDIVQMIGMKHQGKMQFHYYLRDSLQAERNLKNQMNECTRVLSERMKDRHLLNVEACYIPRNQVFNGVSRNAVKEVAMILNAKSQAIAMRCVNTSKQNIAKIMQKVHEAYKRIKTLEPDVDEPHMRTDNHIILEGTAGELDRQELNNLLQGLASWMGECAQKVIATDEKAMQALRDTCLEGVRLSKKMLEEESTEMRKLYAAQKWQAEQARQKLLLEVQSGDVLTWNSPKHLHAWLESIGMEQYTQAFEEQDINSARLLLSLGRVDFEDLGVRMADRKVMANAIEELRLKLYTGKLEVYYQALWTLLGQDFITSQELQSTYAILSGDIRVPEHRKQALQDGLRMLHLNLVPANAVMEVIKDVRTHVRDLLSLEER